MRKKRPPNDHTCNGGRVFWWTSLCALVTRRGLRFRHAGHHAGLPGERAVRRAEHRGRATQPSGLPDGLRGTLSQAAAICMVSQRALRTRWNKRHADRRAYEAGLLRNEWDSLLSAVRGRLLMIATDEGLRAGAMLAHLARLSTTEVQQLVSEVNGTKSGARQAAMVKNIEATVYLDRIRELAGGITTSRPGRGRGPKPRLGMCLLYTSPSPRDRTRSRMPSSA